MRSFRTARMLGALVALLAGLWLLALAADELLERYADVPRYGNHTTPYGWWSLSEAVLMVTAGFGLF